MQSFVTRLFHLMNFVSHHTDRVPDRTFQWERICFACNVWGLNPSGLGGRGKKKQLSSHGQEGEGWREAEEYTCTAALVCSPLSSSPCVHVWEVYDVCTHVCAGTLAHVCTYVFMCVSVMCVWSPYKCMCKYMCLSIWGSEEGVLCLALSLSAMLFWGRVSHQIWS